MKEIADVKEFIERKLISLLQEDVYDENFKIITEADLQSSVYYHLRNYLEEDKEWVIRNLHRVRDSHSTTKPVHPDLLISYVKGDKEFPSFALELKEVKEGGLNSIWYKELKKDVSRLQTLRDKFEFVYLIVLCRELRISSSEIRSRINKELDPKLAPLVLNQFDRFENDMEKIGDWKKRRDHYKQILI